MPDSGVSFTAMPDPSFRPYLGAAAKNLRESQGLRARHIAAEIDVDPSTIYRFEAEHETWPSNPDRLIAAYARRLGISPAMIWGEALRLWQEAAGPTPPPTNVPDPPPERPCVRR